MQKMLLSVLSPVFKSIMLKLTMHVPYRARKQNPIQFLRFLDHETFSTENNGIVKIFDSLLQPRLIVWSVIIFRKEFHHSSGENFCLVMPCECFYAVLASN